MAKQPQTMDTAPRNGTRILIYGKTSIKPENRWVTGFYEYGSWWNDAWHSIAALYWKPLPPKPE